MGLMDTLRGKDQSLFFMAAKDPLWGLEDVPANLSRRERYLLINYHLYLIDGGACDYGDGLKEIITCLMDFAASLDDNDRPCDRQVTKSNNAVSTAMEA